MARKWIFCSLLVAGIVGLPVLGRADTIFSNLGPGGTYNQFNGLAVGKIPNAAQVFDQAVAFTVAPGSGFDVTQIDVALANVQGTNGATVELLTDSGSNIPGNTVLGSWTFTNLPGNGASNSILQTASGISGVALNGGTTYWLAVFPPDNSSFEFWNVNTNLTPGLVAQKLNGGAWTFTSLQETGAFDVLGTPITSTPEPGTISLFGTGLVSLMGLGLRRKRLA